METTTSGLTKRLTGFSTILTKTTQLKCFTIKWSKNLKAAAKKSKLWVTKAKKRISTNTLSDVGLTKKLDTR